MEKKDEDDINMSDVESGEQFAICMCAYVDWD